jgi:outer membrane protein assembly factor BamD (BamD/ComL family)
MILKKQALIVGSFALGMLFLSKVVLQASPLSMHERFRIADQALHAALRGEAEWKRVFELYHHLDQIVEVERDVERARLGLAEVYIGQGDYGNAVAMLDRAYRANGPRRDWVLFRKGMVLMQMATESTSTAQGRSIRNQAIETYRQLARDYPESSRAPQALFFVANNLLVHQRSKQRAARVYQELIDRYPNSREADLASQMLPRIARLTDAQLRELSQ